MKHIVTIGAGLAGIEASAILANLGYHVTLLEKEKVIGGKMHDYAYLFPDFRKASDINDYLNEQLKSEKITLIKDVNIKDVRFSDGKTFITTTKNIHLDADAVIIASGYKAFEAERKEEYGYRIYDNVITSVDLEKMLRQGNKITLKNGNIPKKIAFIHCVGSRDEKSGNHYCSKVCCITGVKQAIELHKQIPDAEIFCFYMDLRMFGQHFEELYREAQEKHTIQFIRGRLSEASENMDESLQIKAEDTLSGRPVKMKVDMMVLLVGMEAGEDTPVLSNKFKVKTGENRFFEPSDLHLRSNLSSRKGVFLTGSCICPMSVNDSIENARSAALEVHHYLQNLA